MQFSAKSIDLLKSLSKVNRSIVLKKGRTQRVTTKNSNIVCEVVLDNEMPIDFAVLDLAQLLNVISSFGETANLEFTEKAVTIKNSSGWTAVYAQCSPELVLQVETMEAIDNDPITLAFDIDAETFSKMIRLAASHGLPQVSFIDTPEGILMQAYNKKEAVNKSVESNKISVMVKTEEKDPSLCVKMPFIASTENLNIETDSYLVTIAQMGFAQFRSKTLDRRYIILSEMEEGY